MRDRDTWLESKSYKNHGRRRHRYFQQTSDLIDRDYFTQADLIITLCGDAKDKCPAVPNNHEHLHWDLKDPAQAVGSEEEILTEFRKVREGIKRKVLDLNQRTSIV